MFSGRISEMVAKQIENKIAEKGDLTSLSDSELSQLAIEFVGDAPPSHVPRETVIQILSQQPEITAWRSHCLLYTSPSPRDKRQYRMPSSA